HVSNTHSSTSSPSSSSPSSSSPHTTLPGGVPAHPILSGGSGTPLHGTLFGGVQPGTPRGPGPGLPIELGGAQGPLPRPDRLGPPEVLGDPVTLAGREHEGDPREVLHRLLLQSTRGPDLPAWGSGTSATTTTGAAYEWGGGGSPQGDGG
ncbi:hypothetical protein Agub_g3384, partial [Astrephomene gubernaculifera]